MKQLTTTKLVSLLLAMIYLATGCSISRESSGSPEVSQEMILGSGTSLANDLMVNLYSEDVRLVLSVIPHPYPYGVELATELGREELIYDLLLQQEIDTFDFEMPLDTYDEFRDFVLVTYPLLQNAGYVPRNYTPTSVDVYSDGVFIVNYDVCDNYYMKDGGICAVFYLGDGSLLSMQTWTGEKLRGKTP